MITCCTELSVFSSFFTCFYPNTNCSFLNVTDRFLHAVDGAVQTYTLTAVWMNCDDN